MDAKTKLKAALPKPALQTLANGYDALARVKELPAAYFHPWRRKSRQAMASYKDKHKGERCFIIGNGPSLRITDLSKLNNEYTIGMNRIFLMFEELGWLPSYYLCVNDLVIEQSAADIQNLNMPRFVGWRARNYLQYEPGLHFLYTSYTGPGFTKDARNRIWEGGTVTYVALQLAYFLGFETVVLIGVDHNYVGQNGKPNETVVSQGADPNHFSPNYFGKGFRWQLPDLVRWEIAYQMAREAYEHDGRQVIDATVGGKLTVFQKAEYLDLFH